MCFWVPFHRMRKNWDKVFFFLQVEELAKPLVTQGHLVMFLIKNFKVQISTDHPIINIELMLFLREKRIAWVTKCLFLFYVHFMV